MSANGNGRAGGVRRNQGLANLQEGSHGRSGEIISYSLFDTVTLVSTQMNFKFFSTPLGQGVPVKTQADTNNLLAGVMPAGQRLTVEMLKIIIFGAATVTDAVQINLFQMLFNTTLEVYLPGKDNLGYWTLAEITGLSTMFPYSATFSGPQPRYTSCYRLTVPIILAAQTAFEVRLVHHIAPNAAINDFRIKLVLAGTLERLS
jgi:hypothetical protein